MDCAEEVVGKACTKVDRRPTLGFSASVTMAVSLAHGTWSGKPANTELVREDSGGWDTACPIQSSSECRASSSGWHLPAAGQQLIYTR